MWHLLLCSDAGNSCFEIPLLHFIFWYQLTQTPSIWQSRSVYCLGLSSWSGMCRVHAGPTSFFLARTLVGCETQHHPDTPIKTWSLMGAVGFAWLGSYMLTVLESAAVVWLHFPWRGSILIALAKGLREVPKQPPDWNPFNIVVLSVSLCFIFILSSSFSFFLSLSVTLSCLSQSAQLFSLRPSVCLSVCLSPFCLCATSGNWVQAMFAIFSAALSLSLFFSAHFCQRSKGFPSTLLYLPSLCAPSIPASPSPSSSTCPTPLSQALHHTRGFHPFEVNFSKQYKSNSRVYLCL